LSGFLGAIGGPIPNFPSERASRLGSVGFFFDCFMAFGFVCPHDARTVQLSLAFHDSNITGTSGPKGRERPRESLSDSDDIKHYPAEQTQLPLPCRGPKADSLRGEVEIAICHLLSFQLTPIPLTEIRRSFVGALQEGQ
jgi:hypothetical protein